MASFCARGLRGTANEACFFVLFRENTAFPACFFGSNDFNHRVPAMRTVVISFQQHPQGGSSNMAKAASAAKKAPSKSEVTNNIAEATSLSKKQVAAVLDALASEIKKSLSNKGPGVFAVPGLVKIEKKKVPARPARKGVPNPFKPG